MVRELTKDGETVNKRRQKKYESRLSASERPKRWPYFIRSGCCGVVVARYAVRPHWSGYGHIVIKHWLSLKAYPFRMVAGEIAGNCPSCGGQGYPQLLTKNPDMEKRNEQLQGKHHPLGHLGGMGEE